MIMLLSQLIFSNLSTIFFKKDFDSMPDYLIYFSTIGIGFNCGEVFFFGLLNKTTNNILEEYYRFFEDSISTEIKKKNPRRYLETVESLVLLSQKHDKMINDFGKDSVEANQILNEYLDYRLKLKIDIEEDISINNDNEIEEKINSYQKIIWSFFNKVKIIYLEHLNEALVIWNDEEEKSIFISSEKPSSNEIN